MGSCAAPSAKGDDKFITTDYLQQCRRANVPGFTAVNVVGRVGAFAGLQGCRASAILQTAQNQIRHGVFHRFAIGVGRVGR
ncbi:hypothetical protein EI050_24265 [Escherichia coli]|nr:hypothetical protein [Escherichia coli]